MPAAPRLALVLVLASLAAAVVTATAGASPATSLVAGIHQDGTVLGDPRAPLTLVEFGDVGCSHCLEFTKGAFPAIVREYVRTGKVKVDFRGLGLVTPASLPALRYVLAAARQDRLWHVLGLLYENQARLDGLVNDASVIRLVRGVKGLDAARLVRDAASPATMRTVASLVRESVRRRVEGTPWFFLRRGDGPLRLVRPTGYDAATFRAILDEALATP